MSKEFQDSLKQKVIVSAPFFTELTKDEGAHKVGDIIPITPAETKALRDQLIPYIDFSGVNTSALDKNNRALKQIDIIIREAMIRDFGKPIVNNSLTVKLASKGEALDETKLTPERIKAFGHDVSQRVANYSQQLVLAEKTFQQCEEKGAKFSSKQKDVIIKNLTSTLNALGSDYLEKNMDSLANDLSNKLKDNRSLVSRITGKPEISTASLGKLTAQFKKEQLPQAEKASFQKLQNQVIAHASTPEAFYTRINYFAKNHGVMDDVSKKSLEEIAKIRLINPKAFDEAVFPQKTENLSSITEILKSPRGIVARAEITHSQALAANTKTDDHWNNKPLPIPKKMMEQIKDNNVKPRPEFIGQTEQQAKNREAALANQKLNLKSKNGHISLPKPTPPLKLQSSWKPGIKPSDHGPGRGG